MTRRRRRGREQTWNDYWISEPEKQLPKEYEHMPFKYVADYKKLQDGKKPKTNEEDKDI